ncbi:MAG TPA: class I SAM-dependent methyltransferase [bacterium]|nr:class I SAM-dependent methyltransferase [bacterium]
MTQIDQSVDSYFSLRGIDSFLEQKNELPSYLVDYLPSNKDARICDIGCGFGRLMIALKERGYENIEGVDQDSKAIHWCEQNGLKVTHEPIASFVENKPSEQFDAVIMSHVLEHLPKDDIISILRKIKSNLLVPGGRIYIMVPNAQSATGCYWAYEDFTHTTLFTVGSLSYVLKAAGFKNLEIIDPDCLAGLSYGRQLVRKILLSVYKIRIAFWNKITASSFHKPSSSVYSFEIKMVAS